MRLRKPTPPLERDIKHGIKELLETVGCHVFNLDQGFRPGGRKHGTTRQTKGLGDLYVLWPRAPLQWRAFWIEVKRPGRSRTPEQVRFAEMGGLAGVPVVLAYSARDVLRFIERVRHGDDPTQVAADLVTAAIARGEKPNETVKPKGVITP